MLINFKVSNYLSFDDEQTFSMASGTSENHPSHIRNINSLRLLRVSAMYGANASGKSNFIKAVSAMKDMVLDNEPIITDRYFRPKPENKDKSSLFEMEMEIDGHTFGYGFEYIISKQCVVDEWLHEIFADKDSKVIFERTGDTIIHSFEGSDKNRIDIYAEDTADKPHRLFLNIMGSRVRSGDIELKVFRDVIEWFRNRLVIMDSAMPFLPNRALDEQYFKKLNSIMSSFGTGMNEVGYETRIGMESIVPQEITDELKKILMTERRKNPMVRTSHVYGSFRDYRISLSDDDSIIFDEIVFRHNNGKSVFHSEEESDGTKKLFAMTANMYADEGDTTYLMDELDSRLHPALTYRFVKMFLKDKNMNEKQLIFTTHESSLMDFELVRRDEIWFVEKDNDGSSHIYSLEEFNERKDKKIEKSYKEGRYGGIPIFSTVFPYEDGA